MSGNVRVTLEVYPHTYNAVPDVCPGVETRPWLLESGFGVACIIGGPAGAVLWCPACEYLALDDDGRQRVWSFDARAAQLRAIGKGRARALVRCRLAPRGEIAVGARP